jgi:g-D-glutamyl-meso-diaminopimelate peptidase
MQKVIAIMLTGLLSIGSLGNFGFIYSEDIFSINHGASYSSDDLYRTAMNLTARYPEILTLEVIGRSIDLNPIYVLILTADVNEAMQREDFNVYRKHYFVEAGTHARENANPSIVMKQIEDFCKDYYDDAHIADFNLSEMLEGAVIHFVPLVNPDGFDLVLFGPGSVRTFMGKMALSTVKDMNYSKFKANLAGVDINRNYPLEYLNAQTGEWIRNIEKNTNALYSPVPRGSFYPGPISGSEPETRTIMRYVLKYDFRNYISYHSRGNVIIASTEWFGREYTSRQSRLAAIASDVTGYDILMSYDENGSGYFSDFAAAQTLKPTVTVETTTAELPTSQLYFAEAYQRTYLLPLYFVQEGERQGYFRYRLYVNGRYERDYPDPDYANYHAVRMGGIIVEGEGTPAFEQ